MELVGWYKLYRKMAEWKYRKDPKMVSLWLYVLENTKYGEDDVRHDDDVKVGQFKTSIKRISESTGLSVRSVRTRIDRLKIDNQIDKVNNGNNTLITTINWSAHQSNDKDGDKRQAKKRQSHTVLSLLRRNKEYIAQIEKIYQEHYPRKKGKTKGIDKILTQIKTDQDIDNFRKAVINYKNECKNKRTETQFIQYFSTFCNKNWLDWIDHKPEFGTGMLNI